MSSEIEVRYSTIEELLHVARTKRKVIRLNSLVGVFKWTPDEFDGEREAGRFPAAASPINFWLQSAETCVLQLRSEIESKTKEMDKLRADLEKFLSYAGGG